jgi:DNA-directed RNA polymerase specialized sigma24 family protein
MAEAESTCPSVPRQFFPETLWTLVREAGQPDAERAARALAKLCEAYHQPVQAWLCARGMDAATAQDATHDLMQHLLERGTLRGCRPESGRFRHYLLAALRNLLQDQAEAQQTVKRGGGWTRVPIETVHLTDGAPSPEHRLDHEFAMVVHRRALQSVRERWQASDRAERFERLRPFVLRQSEEGEYAGLGPVLSLSRAQIKRSVFDLREDYFNAFRQEVAQTVVPEELGDEVHYLVRLLVGDS